MSNPNANWPKWMIGSIYKHFQGQALGNVLLTEGLSPRATLSHDKWAEVRVDGPYMTEISKNYWRLYVEVNIVVSCQQGTNNLYDYQTLIGFWGSLFTDVINAYRLGPGVDDDQSLLGCMSLVQANNERIQISSFGQIEPDSGLQQGTVEGHYHLFLSE